MKPLQIYIEENRLKQLKQEALDKDTSMAEIIRGYLNTEGDAVIHEVNDDAETIPGERIPMSEAEKSYNPPIVMCQHGYAVGLCKFGCKK